MSFGFAFAPIRYPAARGGRARGGAVALHPSSSSGARSSKRSIFFQFFFDL